MEPSTAYANLGEERIAYQIIGDGPVDIVVTAGWWSPFEIDWEEPSIRAFYLRVTRFARVIRGMGVSDPIPLDALPPWESLNDEIMAVMDAVGSERAFVLAAGTAGPAAALFAASHPDRTAGLILAHTTVRYGWDEDYPFGLTADEQAAWIETATENWGGASNALLEMTFPSRASDPADSIPAVFDARGVYRRLEIRADNVESL